MRLEKRDGGGAAGAHVDRALFPGAALRGSAGTAREELTYGFVLSQPRDWPMVRAQ